MLVEFSSGDLVIRRARWSIDSSQIGVIISVNDTTSLVLWSSNLKIILTWHFNNALLHINEHNINSIKDRCDRYTQ